MTEFVSYPATEYRTPVLPVIAGSIAATGSTEDYVRTAEDFAERAVGQLPFASQRPPAIRFDSRYRRVLAYLKAIIARIDLSHFPGSCCG